MAYLIAGAGALFVVLLLLRAFTRSNTMRLAAQLRLSAGIILLIGAAILGLTGRWVAAIPLGGLAFSLLGLRRVPGFRNVGGNSASTEDRYSRVSGQYLEMALRLDDGKMFGRVREGAFAGAELSELSLAQLEQLYQEICGDLDSLALLEAYLDRRAPRWREDFDVHAGDGHAHAPRARDDGVMSEEEAYNILGLTPGVGKAEIRAAHRRLMKRVHPDRGGSTFLAAKLNQAKDILLKRH